MSGRLFGVGVGPGDVHYSWSGTSGATPLVAGIVALVRSAHPELDADDVINRVVATATPKGDSTPDPLYGYGLVDAAAAVTASVPAVDANPMGDLSEWIRVHRRADVPAPSAQATNPRTRPPSRRRCPIRVSPWPCCCPPSRPCGRRASPSSSSRSSAGRRPWSSSVRSVSSGGHGARGKVVCDTPTSRRHSPCPKS